MIASQNSEQTRSYNTGRMTRILIGASAFSGLTIGLGLTATHLLSPSETAHQPAKLASAPIVPSQLKKDASSQAQPQGIKASAVSFKPEAKTARVLPHAAQLASPDTQPLSTDAFERRFVAPASTSALSQPQRFASRLLASPQQNDVRSAFTVRLADASAAMNSARMFQPLKPALPAVAEAGEAVVAMAVPGDLPRALDLEPAPATERVPERVPEAKADPHFSAKAREKAAEAPVEKQKPALRPGKSAKAPVVASLPAKPDNPNKPKTLWQALGFARPDNPEDNRPGRNIPWPGGGKKVAYYDITAQRVYMPNGESMEAHSGQGKLRDNPAFVHVKMRGSTPPSTYRLSMRETLFHGVQALRMTPVNGVNPHNRVGLLTHSYLRRVPGDSAGCVVFKNYPRFLAAYKRGEVDHIVVVASMNKAKVLTAKVASLVSRSR